MGAVDKKNTHHSDRPGYTRSNKALRVGVGPVTGLGQPPETAENERKPRLG